MIIAEQIVSEKFKTVFSRYNFIYEIISIPANTVSEEIELPQIFSDGSIETIRIITTSENFDISLRSRPGITTPSIDEILLITDINLQYHEVKLGIDYSNSEEEGGTEKDKLYMILNNKDVINSTGIFRINLVIKL